MSRKVKAHEWPIYQLTENYGLTAFLGPCDCYQVINRGRNSGNEGISVNHFITRRTAQKLLIGPAADIDVDQFRERYNRVFAGISIKLTGK